MATAALRLIGRCLLILSALLFAYGLAAAALSHVSINRDFRPAAEGIVIAVIDNGVHVDIVTPVSADDRDWRSILPEGSIPEGANWIGFGWGAKAFYLNTPTWADFDPWFGMQALFGIGGATVRTHFRDALYETPATTVIVLTPRQYAALTAAIADAMTLGADGRAMALAHPGYGRDLFLEAHGRYSPILTCNEWASRTLATAGVKTAFWSPFPNGVAPRL